MLLQVKREKKGRKKVGRGGERKGRKKGERGGRKEKGERKEGRRKRKMRNKGGGRKRKGERERRGKYKSNYNNSYSKNCNLLSHLPPSSSPDAPTLPRALHCGYCRYQRILRVR